LVCSAGSLAGLGVGGPDVAAAQAGGQRSWCGRRVVGGRLAAANTPRRLGRAAAVTGRKRRRSIARARGRLEHAVWLGRTARDHVEAIVVARGRAVARDDVAVGDWRRIG